MSALSPTALIALVARIRGAIKRGVVSRTDDSKKVQRFQLDLLADETEDDVEHFQPQGLSFAVQPGAEALVCSVGADPSHLIAICAQDGTRPVGSAPGTGGLYTKGKWRLFIDTQDIVNLGAGAESAKDFVALQQLVKDQFTKLRQQIDNNNTAIINAFNAHTHIVATSMGPGTAAPVASPVVPSQPLGPAEEVAATKTKAT